MNTACMNDEMISVDNSKQTLKTLMQMICSDDEFMILRETLRLYCEEVTKIDA